MRRIVTTIAVAAASMLVMFGQSQAADQVHKTFTLPAEYAAVIGATGCSSSPGPQITVQQGSLTLSGLSADVIFSNMMGSTNPQEQIVVERVVVPDNQQVGIPAQSVVGAIANDPFIWLQLTDQNGRPLTSEIFLGQCDQGQFNVSIHYEAPVEATANVVASDCTSASGPAVTLDGQSALLPVNGKLIFRSSNTPSGVPGKTDEAAVALALLPVGQSFPFPQQAAVAGTGGNPLIAVQLRQASGDVIGNEITLGRCVALSK